MHERSGFAQFILANVIIFGGGVTWALLTGLFGFVIGTAIGLAFLFGWFDVLEKREMKGRPDPHWENTLPRPASKSQRDSYLADHPYFPGD